MHHGSCLCKGVTLTVVGPLVAPNACHRSQCRKSSGHVFAATDAPKSAVTLTTSATLCRYPLSQKVRRGFCGTCGAPSFWEPVFHDWTAVAMGALDGATDTQLGAAYPCGRQGRLL